MMNPAIAWLKRRVGSVAVALLLILTLLWLLEEQQPVALEKKQEVAGLTVTVVEMIPADARIKVNATGITMARWLTEMTASVNGRVIEVASAAMPGSQVKKGGKLASLQDTFYRSEVEAAQARLSEAELNLAETLNRQYVAKRRDNAKSAFGRLEPHVKAAKANRDAAEAALASAEQQLADTQIKAPFDAVVIADYTHPGRWVSSGDVLFQVAASHFIDIKVELAEVNWQRLKGIQQRRDAITVLMPDGRYRPASIRYLSPIMDEVTRQRSLVLQVANPFQGATPILAGQQVNLVFQGDEYRFVVRAPASALTEDGKVWSVVDKTLRLETIELLDEQPEVVLFRYRDRPEQKRLLVRFPLSSFLEGQTVAATRMPR